MRLMAILVSLLTALVVCGSAYAGEQAKLDSGLTTWAVFNGDQFTGRFGWTEGHFEAGLEGVYRDDLAIDDADGYGVGVYGLFLVNPEAQFPIRGWVPGNLEWLPEFIPVSFYIGTKCDLVFEDHQLMPAFLLGAYIKTGVHGSVGAEWQRNFNHWENVIAADAVDVFAASIRWQF